MRLKPLHIILAVSLLLTAAPHVRADMPTADPICGPLWDMRYGEAVVGMWGAKYTPATLASINGFPIKIGELESNAKLEKLRSCPAFGRCDEAGTLLSLELIAPQTTSEFGEIWDTQASRRYVRAGETLRLRLSAPKGGRASFVLTGTAGHFAASESAPGVYTAVFSVPPVNLAGAYVLGCWEGGGKLYRRVGPRLDVSSRDPEIHRFGPLCGSDSGFAYICADYSAWGTDIDPRDVRVWAGSRELSGQAKRSGSYMICRLSGRDAAAPFYCVKVTDRCGGSAKAYCRGR